MKRIVLVKMRPGAEDSLAPVGTRFEYTYKSADRRLATERARNRMMRQIKEENVLDWNVLTDGEARDDEVARWAKRLGRNYTPTKMPEDA